MNKIITGLCFIALSGCTSSPVSQYFVLSGAAQEQQSEARQASDDLKLLAIAPVSVPDYLDRSQMVTVSRGNQVKVHEFARWAEPLSYGIQRALTGLLDQPRTAMTAVNLGSGIRPELTLQTTVERLDVNLDSGDSTLVAVWQLTDKRGQTVVGPHRSSYRASTPEPLTIEQVAATVDELITAYADDIGQSLQHWQSP